MDTCNKTRHIYLASPHMSDNGYEKMYINEAFDTNWIAPLGRNVDEFENEIVKRLDGVEAVAMNSGTAAIHMALKAIGVERGDIVFCQSLTFSATANPIVYLDAIPVFIDSEYETWNMSAIALEKAFEKYAQLDRLPKAVIIVHLYGTCANMDELVPICAKYNVPIIEDAAEALGSTYRGKITDGETKCAGTFGEYSILSFNGNKIITTSGGGMILCNQADRLEAKERADKVKFWITQARDRARHYQHSEIGYNYRMSNVLAGIGRGQLLVLDERIHKKRDMFDTYEKELGDIQDISMMPQLKNTYNNCWLSSMIIERGSPVTPLMIMEALEREDIESRPIWKPMHLQPIFEKYDFISSIEEGSISEDIFNRGVCLPSDTKNTEEDMNRIIDTIKSLWN